MLDLFKSEIFWSAFGALVAFAGLVGTICVAIIALLKAHEGRRLQAVLNEERKFYEEKARRVIPPPVELPEKAITDRYLNSIQSGLLAIVQLPHEQRNKTKGEIRKLISQLRTTHETLVQALKPFTTNNAKRFFEEFDQFNQDFGALYDGGNIPHNARTHCDEVVQIVNELTFQLQADITGLPSERIYKIQEINYSMEHADRDIIVPVMTYILSRTEVELSLINSVIWDGDKRKAIWLKERYRFDIKNLYSQLEDTLTTMSNLVSQL
jgi:hypothetical protein